MKSAGKFLFLIVAALLILLGGGEVRAQAGGTILLTCGGPSWTAPRSGGLTASVQAAGSLLLSGPAETTLVSDTGANGWGICLPIACCAESTSLVLGSIVDFAMSTDVTATATFLVTPESNFSTTVSTGDLFGTMLTLTPTFQSIVQLSPNETFCGDSSNTFLTDVDVSTSTIEPALNSVHCAFVSNTSPAGPHTGSAVYQLSVQ